MRSRCLLLLLLLHAPLRAQDPFGGAQPAQPAAQPAQPPAEIKITNPLVQTLLDTTPDTPSEWVLAINTLIDLKHAPVAKQFVNRLLGANLNEEQLDALHREYGTPALARIAAHPDLAPEGKQLADAVLMAASKQSQD